MALTLKERADSPSFDVGASSGGATRRWFGRGSEDELAVYVATLAAAGEYCQGFVRNKITLTRLGGPNWNIEVGYGSRGAGGSDVPTGANGLGGSGSPNPTAPADTEPLLGGWSFEVSNQTIRVNKSRATWFKRTAADNAGIGNPGDDTFVGTGRDNARAIGINEDGEIAGTEILTGALEWSRTVHRATVTLKYMRQIKALIGTTNIQPFYGFGVGELLYLGASGQFTQGQGWSITHRFASGETETNIDVGGIIIPVKRPFEYLWVSYKTEPVGGRLMPVPDVAYVEEVYPEGYFNGQVLLGTRIGGLEIGE